jgi:transposase
MDLTDEQWARIANLLPDPPTEGRGRPRRHSREVLSGILWVLRTGAPWADLPARYPPYQTCHRRFQEWVDDGTFVKVLKGVAEDLKSRGGIDLREVFIDGTHAGAKKGGPVLDAHDVGLRPRSWQWQTLTVFLFLSPSLLDLVMKSRSSRKR